MQLCTLIKVQEYADIRTAAKNLGEEDRIDDLSEVAEHIRTKSEELTVGKSKITSTEIYLRIFRKNFVDLTLVDLPGLYYGNGMNETINC